ncbi:MAG: Gldg family protein, partial [Gammaproteobacteria bacterium]
EKGFLGIVGTNAVDDEIPIPLLSPEREGALEYDLTKMIYNLSHPTKRVIGLLSGLPLLSRPQNPATGEPASREWGVVKLLREIYDVRSLNQDLTEIDPDIDTLLVVHPKAFPENALYAIDQFVIRGGRAIVFVDPFAEEDRPERDPTQPMAMPEISSGLEPIFEKWGIAMATDKVATDIDAAVRVSFRSETGPLEVEYLPWLQLQGARLNREDFVTTELNSVNVGSAGAVVAIEGAATTFTPLLKTGENAGQLERDSIIFVRDPTALLENFEPTGESSTIAARINGIVETAFADGKPLAEEDSRAPADENFLSTSTSPINVIVVADTDILADRFWLRYENFLGMKMPQAFANNADFLINAIDNLGGNDDLISLRTRSEYSRPFVVVQQIRRDAEAQFRDRERALQAKLKETEMNLQQLQQQRGDGGEYLVSPEQRNEIELFRGEQLKTRKELRSVQHELQKNIEQLGSWLKFINIGLIPILISIFAVGIGIYGSRRQISN